MIRAMASPTRRQFLKGMAALSSVPFIAAAPACRRRDAVVTPPSDAGLVVPAAPVSESGLGVGEMAVIGAVCDRLLPRDQDPGALDLGVPAYIDRALATPALASSKRLLQQVIPILDRQSRERHGGRGFVDATPPQKDALLAAWQRGKGGDRRFFDVMLALTLEGAFGDPRHGGNKEGLGFALIGFAPGPPMLHHHAGKDQPAH